MLMHVKILSILGHSLEEAKSFYRFGLKLYYLLFYKYQMKKGQEFWGEMINLGDVRIFRYKNTKDFT